MVVDDLDVAEIRGWAVGLSALHQRIAKHFVRAEPRQQAYDYLRALIRCPCPIGHTALIKMGAAHIGHLIPVVGSYFHVRLPCAFRHTASMKMGAVRISHPEPGRGQLFSHQPPMRFPAHRRHENPVDSPHRLALRSTLPWCHESEH